MCALAEACAFNAGSSSTPTNADALDLTTLKIEQKRLVSGTTPSDSEGTGEGATGETPALFE